MSCRVVSCRVVHAGAVDYWWSHALISDQTATGIRANCNFSRIGEVARDSNLGVLQHFNEQVGLINDRVTPACTAWMSLAPCWSTPFRCTTHRTHTPPVSCPRPPGPPPRARLLRHTRRAVRRLLQQVLGWSWCVHTYPSFCGPCLAESFLIKEHACLHARTVCATPHGALGARQLVTCSSACVLPCVLPCAPNVTGVH